MANQPEAVAFGAGFRVHWPNRAGTDRLVVQLGRAAVLALRAEDVSLHAAMSATEEFKKEARGLTYWLYETTLCYIVFKAWAQRWHVKWDWEPAGRKRTQRERSDRWTLAKLGLPRSPRHSTFAATQLLAARVRLGIPSPEVTELEGLSPSHASPAPLILLEA